ncbi:hypothetical protein PMAYCL1PPCAC_24409, partial [Pristionchus mayeri]
QILIRCYDILPAVAFIIYIIITVLILKRRSSLSSSKTRSDFKTLAQGFVVLLVYGVGCKWKFMQKQHISLLRVNSGALMQFLLFLYISVDVITVTVIPLSIFLTVPALRAAPYEMVKGWRARNRRSTL